MLCYKDKTFCASEGPHSCGREITKTEEMEAARIGLPIAYGDFCEKPVTPHTEEKEN